MMPGSKGPWGSHEITGTATPGPGQSQALSASGPSAHLPCAPSSVPWGQAQDRDTPGPLPFASQGFKSRKGLWRPGVPTGNPRLGPMCGLRWVTCPITVTLRPWHGPRAVTPALQPPYTPTAPPLLAALTPTPSPPHLSRCPKPPSPHTPSASLIFSAGAHSSSSSSPFRGPGGKKGREEVLRAPEQPGAWLTSHGDPGCAGPAPRDTPLWSLPFSTVHLSSVSSSLGLLPSFLGFSGGWKVGRACRLSPGLRGASGGRWGGGQACPGGWAGGGGQLPGSTHSAPPSPHLFPGQGQASGAWEAGSNSPLWGGRALMRWPTTSRGS